MLLVVGVHSSLIQSREQHLSAPARTVVDLQAPVSTTSTISTISTISIISTISTISTSTAALGVLAQLCSKRSVDRVVTAAVAVAVCNKHGVHRGRGSAPLIPDLRKAIGRGLRRPQARLVVESALHLVVAKVCAVAVSCTAVVAMV